MSSKKMLINIKGRMWVNTKLVIWLSYGHNSGGLPQISYKLYGSREWLDVYFDDEVEAQAIFKKINDGGRFVRIKNKFYVASNMVTTMWAVTTDDTMQDGLLISTVDGSDELVTYRHESDRDKVYRGLIASINK